jgi:branched-chain amino acid transport system ATP-binding protein
MLEVKQLVVKYGDFVAVRNASLKVKDKEIVLLFGPNGAGKTSLLKAISGLISPSSGEIKFDGTLLNGLKPHEIARKGIAHAPEGRRLFPNLSVKENLEIGAYGKPKKLRKEFMKTIYDFFPRLKERENQLASSLSGGEQQMLAIGRALISMPKFLIIDEPSLGLAPIVVEQLFEVLKRVSKEMEVSTLLVEQNVSLGLETADRGYLMEQGSVILEGSRDFLIANETVRQKYLGI